MRNTARIIRYVHGNINLLNILLVMAIGATLLLAVLPMVRMRATVALPRVKVPPPYQAPKAAEVSALSSADYAMIGENNLFHPERKIPPLKKDEKVLPKPELVLYGTVMADDVALAFIEDKKAPKTTPGRGQRQQVVKKGDVLTGFVIKEIQADRISLVRGEETMTVFLSDESKRKRSQATTGAPGMASRSPRAPQTSSPATPNRAQRLVPTPAPPSVSARPVTLPPVPVRAPTPVSLQGARGAK